MYLSKAGWRRNGNWFVPESVSRSSVAYSCVFIIQTFNKTTKQNSLHLLEAGMLPHMTQVDHEEDTCGQIFSAEIVHLGTKAINIIYGLNRGSKTSDGWYHRVADITA
jgi:hypothetical protein